jgi:hypothetical protein
LFLIAQFKLSSLATLQPQTKGTLSSAARHIYLPTLLSTFNSPSVYILNVAMKAQIYLLVLLLVLLLALPFTAE